MRQRLTTWLGKTEKKSAGERKLLAMLNNNQTAVVGNLWSNQRLELPNHVTGWHHAAIDSKASEIAGMTPNFAYKRDDAEGAITKSVKKAFGTNRRLTDLQRKKALTGLAAHVQLEAVSSEHPLVRLNARPNPIDCAWTFNYKKAMFLFIFGEAYRWNVPNQLGSYPVESWIIPTHWVWPLPGTDRLVSEYEIRPVAGLMPTEGGYYWFGGAAGKWKIPAEQMVHYFLPTPHNLIGGYSPIAACSAWTDCADNIDKSRVFKFQNDAFPNVAVVFDKEIDPDSISQTEIDRLKMMIKEKYGGVRRTGEPAVLGPGMSLQVLSATPRDMDYCEGFAQMRDSIMAAHKTGPVILGLGNETTHAAAKAVRAGWHTAAITPITRMFGQVETEHMCRPMDEDLICYWPDSIPEDVEFEHKQRIDCVKHDILQINEARAQLGLEPKDGMDVTLSEWVALNSVPKGLGDGQGEVLPLGIGGDKPEPDHNRLAGIFSPSANGNGHGSTLDTKSKALADLSVKYLLT